MIKPSTGCQTHANNRFYVIEGDNGVGKTSVINWLSQYPRIIRFKTPGMQYETIRDYVHQRGSLYSKLLYYTSSVLDVSLDIPKALENSTVFCDRYIASSFVDFLVLSKLEFKDIIPVYELTKKHLVMPDITVWIKCTHEERLRRCRQRNSGFNPRDNLTRHYSEKTEEFYRMFSEYERNWYVIDSTEKSLEEVCQEVTNLKNGRV
jgi:thymidylate kinase